MNKQTNLDISRALKTNDVKNNYNHSNRSIAMKMNLWKKGEIAEMKQKHE